MKLFIRLILLSLIVGSFPSHAFVAFCKAFGEGGEHGFPNHILLFSNLTFECTIPQKGGNGIDRDIYLKTYGPGLQFNAMEGLVITCPVTSIKKVERKIDKKGKWRAYGVGASANFLLGGRAGVAINHNLDICSITGISAGTVGASIGVIEISMDKDS